MSTTIDEPTAVDAEPTAVDLKALADKAAATADEAAAALATAQTKAAEAQAERDRLQMADIESRRTRSEQVEAHIVRSASTLHEEVEAELAAAKDAVRTAFIDSDLGKALVRQFAAQRLLFDIDRRISGAHAELTGAPRVSYEMPPSPRQFDVIVGPIVDQLGEAASRAAQRGFADAIGRYVEGSTTDLPASLAAAADSAVPATGAGHGQVSPVRQGADLSESTQMERNPAAPPRPSPESAANNYHRGERVVTVKGRGN